MRIVFCIYDFREPQLPLQPWLTILNVATGLSEKGFEVSVVTDCEQTPLIGGLNIHTVRSLRGTNSAELISLIKRLKPDIVVSLPTPLSVITSGWLDSLDNCRHIGFASYPFYTKKELYRAARCLSWGDVKQYIRHTLIPRSLWVTSLKKRYHAIITQSETTGNRLQEYGVNSDMCFYIPPGIDKEKWHLKIKSSNDADVTKLLYMGSALPIRGFNVLLDALSRVDEPGIQLTVLARRATGSELENIQSLIQEYRLSGRVTVIGGWADKATLIDKLHDADAVVLPFVLVPSELPVTVMEAIACGTPVIGSRIDGIPSTIGPAGCVARQADPNDLASVIKEFHIDPSIRKDWAKGCTIQREKMSEWSNVIDLWEGVVLNEKR